MPQKDFAAFLFILAVAAAVAVGAIAFGPVLTPRGCPPHAASAPALVPAAGMVPNAITPIARAAKLSIVKFMVVYDPAQTKVNGANAGSGTGYVVAPGVVATSWHVVDGAAMVFVTTPSGKTVYSDRVVRDPTVDLAFVLVPKELTPAPLPLSRRYPELGESVLAVGNVAGDGISVRLGIVSSAHVRVDESELKGGMVDGIQTDAAMSGGDSGGPLLDFNGEVVGMMTAALSGRGIGYALPAADVRSAYASYAKHGRIRRATVALPLESDMQGRLVVAQPAGSARAGDEVLSIDGVAVPGAAAFNERVALHKQGDVAVVRLRRESRVVTLRLKVREVKPER